MTSQKKAEPFRVTGPGTYQTRDIQQVTIRRASSFEFGREWLWTSDDYLKTGGIGKAWREDGTFSGIANISHPLDLIARIDDPAEELAGLSGYVAVRQVVNSDYDVMGFDGPEDVNFASRPYLIDLSTIRKDQLVQPQPKTETRKVWSILWKDGSVTNHTSDPRVIGDSLRRENIVSSTMTEITFKHGEGLGQELPS